MAREYTKEDLESAGKLFANRLRTRVLEEFYSENLVSRAYIYVLENGQTIHLLFEEEQFCHLLGFSYFGYNGTSGWNALKGRNVLVSNLRDFGRHKREEIRITNFPKILNILDDPAVYFYKNMDMRYKSDYFAVWQDEKRYYKLGIGIGFHGINYGETYQVSLIHSDDNKEVNPDHLLEVKQKFRMPKETFKELYYPLRITVEKQKKQIEELQKMQWEMMVHSSTD